MALFSCYCVEIKLLLSGKKKKKGHTRGKRNCIKSAQVKLCTFTSPSQRCHGFPPARCWSQTLAMFGALIVHLGGFFTYSYHYLRFNDQAQWFVFIGLHRHAHTCISGAFPFGNDTRKNNLTLIGSSCQACSCIKHFLLLTLKKKKKKCLFFFGKRDEIGEDRILDETSYLWRRCVSFEPTKQCLLNLRCDPPPCWKKPFNTKHTGNTTILQEFSF